MDEVKAVDIIFLDFTKTFDTVPANILLDKLSNSEINKITLCWVTNQMNGGLRVVVNAATFQQQPFTSLLYH